MFRTDDRIVKDVNDLPVKHIMDSSRYNISRDIKGKTAVFHKILKVLLVMINLIKVLVFKPLRRQ